MKLIIPMAGHGSRFANAGESRPKPLVEVAGHPMIAWAMAGLADLDFEQVIFIALREHDTRYGLSAQLHQLFGARARVVLIDEVTEGQLCTVLHARALLRYDDEVVVGGCDTYVQGGLAEAIARRPRDVRGILSVAQLPGDRWSFARTDAAGDVVEVAEKRRISSWASTGLYYFASASELLLFADRMIAADRRSRGEFFVAPLYDLFLQAGLRVQIAEATKVADMGTPAAAEQFERRWNAGELPIWPSLSGFHRWPARGADTTGSGGDRREGRARRNRRIHRQAQAVRPLAEGPATPTRRLRPPPTCHRTAWAPELTL